MNEPKLRFKADDGNQFPSWDEKKLGDICTPLTYGMNVAAIKYDGLNKYIRITDIDDESHLYKSDEYVSPNGVLDDRYLVGENDILFARTGASVGKSYIYNKKDGKLYYAGFLIKAHVKSENSNFVFYQTLTERYAKWVQLTSMRSGQPGINANEYSEFGIQIPCLQEQQKTASLFTELDNLIQSAEKELEGYRELKQGMLQKMFSKKGEKVPEIRFPEFTGDWEQRKLGDIADVTKLAGFEFTKHVVYSDEGNIIALRGLNIKNGQLILDDVKYIDGSNFSKLSRSKLFIDDIMFTYVGTVGEVAIIKENDRFYLAPNVSRIRVKSDDSPKFISHYMRTDNFKNKVIFPLIATSSQPALSMENIRKFTINIPTNREEQDRLAKYFDNLDNLITLQQRELDGYKELKKGLLQQMFC